MSQLAVHTAQNVRSATIARIEAIPEELFDIQPSPFNNTIRWNLGHVILILDVLVNQRITNTSKLPAIYADLFKGGSKPSDWSATPPTKAEMVDMLKQQLEDVKETFKDRLTEPLETPFQIRHMQFNTVEDVISFNFMHETMHSAIIGCMEKLVSNQK